MNKINSYSYVRTLTIARAVWDRSCSLSAVKTAFDKNMGTTTAAQSVHYYIDGKKVLLAGYLSLKSLFF